jgi:crossover junction endodeoxyribonuclease RusA
MPVVELNLSFLPKPKANRYMRAKGRVFLPYKVSKSIDRAVSEVKSQYKGEPLRGMLAVDVEFILPDNRKRDMDNLLKSLWDILQRAKVIEDDGHIYELQAKKRVIKGMGGVKVVISSLAQR